MQEEDIAKIIRIAKLYYENSLSQDEIAKALSLSRPMVSRLLAKAKQLGYVNITINDPTTSIKQAEQQLAKMFDLKVVKIVDTPINDSRQIKKALAKAASEFLLTVLEPGDLLGTSWGTTIYEIVKCIPENVINDITVVQLKGSITECPNSINTLEVVTEFAHKLSGKAVYLPVPVIVESKFIRDTLLSDKSIRKVFDVVNRCNIALYSIGYPSEKSILVSSGYFSGEKLESMRSQGAVGDICSRFFDINGKVFDEKLNDRTISIELQELRNKDYAIAVAGGENLVNGILGALRGGYLNVLITDETAALKILKIANQEFDLS